MTLSSSISRHLLLLFFPGHGRAAPLGVLAVALSLPRPAAAGGPSVPSGTLVICDSTDDRLIALVDRNGSGTAEAEVPGEVFVFYDDSSPGPDLSTPAHMARGPDGAILVLDGGTLDVVLRLLDRNGDGDANDAGEVSVYYDASAGGPRLFTPNTFISLPDGVSYLSDDGSAAKRILRLADLNGDRDALDPGEALIAYDATALSVPVLEDVESLVAVTDGHIFAGDTTSHAIYELQDFTGDGDFLDENELRLFFQSEGDLLLGDLDSLAIEGEAVIVADEDTGRFVRLRDGNADGDAADPGEAVVFLDATASVRVGDVNDFIALEGGGLLVLDGAKDTVFFVADGNADGDALDEGEVVEWLSDDGTTFSTPNGLAFLPGNILPPPSGEFIRAEVTGDERLDISDPVATLNFLFLGAQVSVCLDAVDADDSGVVNISDAVYGLNFLFLGGMPPPPPVPGRGPDPTPDATDC